MGEDPTRFGGGDGEDGNRTSIQSRRIQVRMPSGKIYGPYHREEVLGFIRSRKVKGEEAILLEGTSDWRPITSDPEFFDLLQEVVFGVKPTSVAAKPAPVPISVPAPSPKLVVENTEPRPMPVLAEDLSPPRRSGAGGSVPLKLPTEQEPVYGGDPTLSPGASPTQPMAPTGVAKPKRNPLVLAAVGGVALLIAGLALKDGKSGGDGKGGLGQVALPSGLKTNIFYGRPLASVLASLPSPMPPMPGLLEKGGFPAAEEGFGAQAWVRNLRELLQTMPSETLSHANAWRSIAWNTRWLATAQELFDPAGAKTLAKRASQIFAAVESGGAITPAEHALFEAIPSFAEGEWKDLVKGLTPQRGNEMADWLLDSAAWWSFWEGGARGAPPTLVRDNYTAASMDLVAKARRAFLARDKAIFDLLDHLSQIDPLSVDLWFISGQAYWRLGANQVQKAYGRLTTGLATLSLQPRSIQKVYWGQYAEFIGVFGRQATAGAALANRALIEKGVSLGDPEKTKKWWDLEQEGLEVSRFAQEIMTYAATNPLAEYQIAALQVLGPVFSGGARALVEAGRYLAFEDDWDRATAIFEQAYRIDPKSVDALGSLVWAHASRYRFDKAFEKAAELGRVPGAGLEPKLYDAVIRLYGREEEQAKAAFDEYARQVPNDAWGHYFGALLDLRLEKNVDCMKSANLAKAHGQGELRFRANLLKMKCQLLSNVAPRGVIEELRKMSAADPRNQTITLAYAESLLQLELTDEAFRVLDDSLRMYPHSFKLRMAMGALYERKRDPDRAVAFYTSAAKESQTAAEPRVRIAKVYETQGRFLDAAQNYETASHVEPGYPEISLLAARAYDKAHQWKEASRLYLREIEERPSVMTNFIEAAEFMLRINAPQEVPKIFQRYKSNLQDNPRVLTRLAQAYFALRETDNARSAAQTALARDPNIPDAHRILAAILEQEGLYEPARESYEKYLELLPQATDADEIRAKLRRPPFQ
jgi:tetratricopeptide (TPR) repeat protein